MFFPWKQGVLGRGLVMLVTLLYPPPGYASRSSLFESSKFVQELNPDTFATVSESLQPWVIDCYSPGCSHCTRFAPTWEQVGSSLLGSPIRVGAVNCIQHRDLCKSLTAYGYPTIVAINWPNAPPGTADKPSVKIMKSGAHSVEKSLALVKEMFPGVLGDNPTARVLDSGVLSPSLEVGHPGGGRGATCALRIEDALVSIRWVLRNEVFTEGYELSKERMGAILSFLDLLATTFPGKLNRASFRDLGAELRDDPGLNNMGRWDKRIGNLHIGSFAPNGDPNWPAANIERGTEVATIHYTSGLWSLLHVLSVSSAPMRKKPYAVMEGIGSFVDKFFRCEVCHTHFMKMYATCDNQRCNIPKPSTLRSQQSREGEPALALWVWHMHNAVNARLAEEGDEDIEAHRSLWPSPEICKDCWSGFPPERGQPPWSEDEVLKFLEATYSCPNAVGEGEDYPGNSWAMTCVLVCAMVSLVMWARRWQEMRGVGLTKKGVDTGPNV